MRSLVNSYYKKYGIPLSIIGTNSISRIVFTDQKFKNRMERDYLEQGTQNKQIEFRKKCLVKIFYGQIMEYYLLVFVIRKKRLKI